MARMILGDFTFPADFPCKTTFDIIRSKKSAAVVDTYNNVAYFSWTPQLAGQIINLEWDHLPGSDFTSLDVLYLADDTIVWDVLGDGTKCFNVIIKSLEGTYWLRFDGTYYRKDVKMELLILSMLEL